jgi:hypothetical protein
MPVVAPGRVPVLRGSASHRTSPVAASRTTTVSPASGSDEAAMVTRLPPGPATKRWKPKNPASTGSVHNGSQAPAPQPSASKA